MADSEPAWKLFQQIRNSEGERLHWKMEALRAIYFAFAANYGELIKSIEDFEQAPTSKYVAVDSREAMRHFQRDNLRLLLNFLSAAFTLVDHTRILTEELYQEHPFKDEYQLEVKKVFVESDVAALVNGLRNWMLHKGLVPVSMQSSIFMAEERLVNSILNVEELREWTRWKPRAKAYLSAAAADVVVRDIVKSYHDLVENFYQWLGIRMSQIHAAAFTELAELQKQYLKVRPQEFR